MSLYGIQQLANGMRAVRANTILMAEDIPEEQFGFRATPETRSVAETLVHIAWLYSSDRILHVDAHIDTVEGYDFAAHLALSQFEERLPRTKADIIALLRDAGERQAQWLEQMPDAFLAERVSFPGGGSMSRFEWLMSTKEHELQHRAQLTVLTRLLGMTPRFTGLS